MHPFFTIRQLLHITRISLTQLLLVCLVAGMCGAVPTMAQDRL